MEDTEKRVEESSNKLNNLEAEVYTRALNQEVDFMKYLIILKLCMYLLE